MEEDPSVESRRPMWVWWVSEVWRPGDEARTGDEDPEPRAGEGDAERWWEGKAERWQPPPCGREATGEASMEEDPSAESRCPAWWVWQVSHVWRVSEEGGGSRARIETWSLVERCGTGVRWCVTSSVRT